MGSAACHCSVHSHATKGGKESSRESELSHDEEDTADEDEDAEADKGGVETASDSQVASDGKEGQECPQTQDTLTGVSQVFGTHEDTDPESDPGEKIQSVWRKRLPKSLKDSPPPPGIQQIIFQGRASVKVGLCHQPTLLDPGPQHQLGDSRLYAEGTAQHRMLTTPPCRSSR